MSKAAINGKKDTKDKSFVLLELYCNTLFNLRRNMEECSLTKGYKQQKNIKSPALKVIAFERCSLTRGFDYNCLTGKSLVFWKTGRLGEVVAHGGSGVEQTNVT